MYLASHVNPPVIQNNQHPLLLELQSQMQEMALEIQRLEEDNYHLQLFMHQKQSTIEHNHVTLERPTTTIENHLSNHNTEQYDEDFEQEDAKLQQLDKNKIQLSTPSKQSPNKLQKVDNALSIAIEEDVISDEEEDYIKQTADFDNEIIKVR